MTEEIKIVPKAPKPKKKPESGLYVGRRKESVARVRLTKGSGEWIVNGKTLDEYLPDKVHQQLVKSPLVLFDEAGNFDVFVNVRGGGKSGQAGAICLGVARALNALDAETYRAKLKRSGFLRVDARRVERKKAGLKKARKAPQFSKR
ncbi:MAG: 30S ribosomal protein S9 [Bifidobacteriaceae bacterium]|jgi:small subunit ribosomal protein S9|nr:30S ribosomal protein S9 [Bifidobacteriaceae bacterium]